jgi:hypothetical protein
VRVSAKKQNGNWMKSKTWLREHQKDYDTTYQEKPMTAAEYVELIYHLQQERRMAELHAKSSNTLR